MQRLVKFNSVATLILLHATSAHAYLPSHSRALQVGPIGPINMYTDIERYEIEATLSTKSTSATSKEGDSKVEYKEGLTALAAGFGVRLNPDMLFTGSATYEGVAGTVADSDYQSSFTEIVAGPVLRVGGRLHLGASVGGRSYGSSEFVGTSNGIETTTTVPGTLVPLVQGFAGVKGKALAMSAGARFFNKSSVDATVESDGFESAIEVDRVVPGEVWLDARMQMSEELAFAPGLTYRLTGQSNGYEHTVVTGKRTEKNHAQFHMCAYYQANDSVSLNAGAHYIQASYESEENASLHNVGGYRADVGLRTQMLQLGFFFNLQYDLPNKVSYQGSVDDAEIEVAAWTLDLGIKNNF